MAEEAFDVRELAEALPASDLKRDPDFFPLNDLPNDVLVSVFAVAAAEDPIWVRHTFPLVCKAWNELYLTKDASPLHETLEVDFKEEVKRAWQEWLRRVARPVAGAATQELAPYRPVVHASRVISWAEKRASSVLELSLVMSYGGAFKDFSPEELGKLVAVVGSSLIEISIGFGVNKLVQRPFWESLRDVVVPAGRLRRFFSEADPSDSDVEPLGQLAGSLVELKLWAGPDRSQPAGLPRFPESFCALKKLRRLVLAGHRQITEIPAGISSLKKLKSLALFHCGLFSLPKELGDLSGLTKLELGGNENLGNTLPAAAAFPAELAKMKSLRVLELYICGLRAVPAFVGGLKSLEVLDLQYNNDLQIDAPLDFLIEDCPRLREVRLEKGRGGVPWTPESLVHLEAFKAKWRAKNPGVNLKPE